MRYVNCISFNFKFLFQVDVVPRNEEFTTRYFVSIVLRLLTSFSSI